MKIKSQILTQVSGSLGGLVGSHNRGGMYFRARSIPVNPATQYQAAVRQALAQLNARWVTTLTAGQRLLWAVYADNVPLTDTLGEPRNVTALNMYLRSNVVGIQNGLSIVDDAPTTYDTGGDAEFLVGTSSVDATADELDLAFDNGESWANETGGAMIVAVSRPQNASINFFKGPFRTVGTIDGDDTTPPTSPATFTLPWTVEAGQQIFVQTRVRRADGRLNLPFSSGFVAS